MFSTTPVLQRVAGGGVALLLCAGLAGAQSFNNHEVIVGPNGANIFTPEDLTVMEGDTVTWVWDVGFHNVREVNNAFTSGNPVVGPNTFAVTFDAAFLAANPSPGDRYDYQCDVHVSFGMIGSVTVVGVRSTGASASVASGGSITVVGGEPGNTLLLGYSLFGGGPTSTPFGTLSLSTPFEQFPPQTFDPGGDVNFFVPNVPPGAQGRTVHIHGMELLGGGRGVFIQPASFVVM